MTHKEELINTISKCKTTGGQKPLLKHLRGQKIGRPQAMKAKCYECMGYYVDGNHDCEITTCPLYPWMPFAADKVAARKEKQARKDALNPIPKPAPKKRGRKPKNPCPPPSPL